VSIEVHPSALQRAAPQLADVGAEVDALGSGTLGPVAGAGGAVGDVALGGAVDALVKGVNAAVQGAVLCLDEVGRRVEAAAREYATRDADVARTMRPGPQP
jgi:hypothetical protein